MSTNNMTAKKAMSILKGELDRTRAHFKLLKYDASRLDRALGGDGGTEDVAGALARVEAAYEYALNSLAVTRKSGKSALKEAKRRGVAVSISAKAPLAPAPEAPADDDGDDAPYEDDDAPF